MTMLATYLAEITVRIAISADTRMNLTIMLNLHLHTSFAHMIRRQHSINKIFRISTINHT